MWRYRLIGWVLTASGGAVFGFLWTEAAVGTGCTGFIFRAGMPGVLLIALVCTVSMIVGAHLLLARRSALMRRTLRLVRND